MLAIYLQSATSSQTSSAPQIRYYETLTQKQVDRPPQDYNSAIWFVVQAGWWLCIRVREPVYDQSDKVTNEFPVRMFRCCNSMSTNYMYECWLFDSFDLPTIRLSQSKRRIISANNSQLSYISIHVLCIRYNPTSMRSQGA